MTMNAARPGGQRTPATSTQVPFGSEVRGSAIDVALLSARIGRIAFVPGLALGVALFAAVRPAALWQLFLAGWMGAFICAIAVTHAARSLLSRRRIIPAGDRLLQASVVAPFIAVALCLPLTLHMPFSLATDGPRGFEAWAGISAILVGHAHLVLATLGALRLSALADGHEAMSAQKVYAFTVLAAMVPGLVILMIPPLLVAATGLVFFPVFQLFEAIIDDDRAKRGKAGPQPLNPSAFRR